MVWMTFANSAFADLALNWAAHVYRLGKERQLVRAARFGGANSASQLRRAIRRAILRRPPLHQPPQVLAALDRPFQAKMRAERLPYFNFHEGSTRDLRSNVSAFRALGALKGELVLRVLAARRHVLLSDVDVIWLRDPRACCSTARSAPPT